jgi:hypothetical protein
MAKPQIVLEIKTYADGVLVAQTAKVVEPEPDWIKRIVLTVAIPWGFWLMAMGGMF